MLIENQIGTSKSLNNSTEVEEIINTAKEGTSHNFKKENITKVFKNVKIY